MEDFKIIGTIQKKKKSSKREFAFNDEKLSNLTLEIKTFKNEDFSSLNLPKNKDLIPGQYEGGIKIWECCLDLCNFLPPYVGWHDLKDLKVLELGCGHGLPGLYFLLRESYVMFQDYNQEILESITHGYVKQIKDEHSVDLSNRAAYMNGDWKEFNEKKVNKDFYADDSTKEVFSTAEFDIIVSADTIYNIENYEAFYNIIITNLKNPGICFICSKKFYFGVGGGTSQFIDFVTKKGEFEIKVAKEFNDGVSNIRQILEMRHISN